MEIIDKVLQSVSDSLPFAAVIFAATLGVTLLCTPAGIIKILPKLVIMSVLQPKFDPRGLVKEIAGYADIARAKGLLALEDCAENCRDEFLKQALFLLIDNRDRDKIRDILDDGITYMRERHTAGRDFFARAMSLGTVFGIVGTLTWFAVTLYGALFVSGGFGHTFGDGAAAAILMTFYGAFMSNALFAPFERALSAIDDREILCKKIIAEGVMCVADGFNPSNIQEKLEIMFF